MNNNILSSQRKEAGMSASRWIFALCFLVYSVSYIARGSFSFVRTTMIDDGAITATVAGAVSAAYFILYAVGQLINGFLGDKLSPFAMVSVGLFVVIGSNILMAIPQPMPLYVIWWGINGYGHSMLWSPVFFIISNIVSSKMRAFALTAISVCAPAGKIMSALISGAIISFGPWQSVFFSVSVIALCVLVLWVARYITLAKRDGALREALKKDGSDKATVEETVEGKRKRRNIFTLLLVSGVAIMLPAMLVHGLFYNGVVELIPTILHDEYEMTATMAAIIEIIIPILSVAGIFLANLVYYKLFKKNDMRSAAFLMGITLIPIAIMLLLGFFKRDGYMIGQYADAIIFVTTYALVYLFQFGFNHVAIVLLPAKFSKFSYSSTVSGIANAINYGGSAISTYGMTYALLKLELWQTVLIWAGVLAFAFLLVLLAQGRWSRFARAELSGVSDKK